MNIRSALRVGVSRFAHLGMTSIPATAKAATPAVASPPAAPAVPAAATPAPVPRVEEPAAVRTDAPDDDDDDDAECEGEEEVKKAKAAGHSGALKAVVRTEKKRCAAIFASEHAAGRIPLACELAFGTSMTAAAAIRVLSAATPDQATNPLAAALAAQPKHDIGTDAGGRSGAESPDQKLIAAAEARAKQTAKAA